MSPGPSEPDPARRTAIANERAKLLANALDRASTACVTVGILGPIAAALYGVSAPAKGTLYIVASGLSWLATAAVLHLMARVTLGRIR